jgi:hypothetical protein
MKSLTFLSSIFIFTFSIQGQDSSQLQIIEKFIRQKQDTAQIFYYDSVARSYRVQDIKHRLSRDKFRFVADDSLSISLKLTKAERKLLFRQLDSMHTLTWGANLFANSRKVTSDSSSIYWKMMAEANKVGWKPKTGMQIWEFTNPVCLRQNSICLVYILYICGGLCGHDELCFYKNINGTWHKWITIASGYF